MYAIKRWDEEMSTGDTNGLLQLLSTTLLSRISSQSAGLRDTITACINSGDYGSLCGLELDYSRLSVADAIALRQVLAFYTKRVDLDMGVDRRQVAWKKFLEAEGLCLRTNTLFRGVAEGTFSWFPRVEHVLHIARQKIAHILGPVPSLSELKFRFGPGATVNVKKRDASPRMKLSAPLQCSEDLLPGVTELLAEMPWLTMKNTVGQLLEELMGFPEDAEPSTVSLDIVPGRLCFVPKNAKTDRAIVNEPGLNVMYQLGIGRFIAQRLKRFGVDIRDQSYNQRLAREGSLTGALATLDLSSASDTIAYRLVLDLLPIDWFVLLDNGRSSTIEAKGREMRLHKFSSMGNGFTFPLETLLFYALAKSAVEVDAMARPLLDDAWGEESRVNAYGDDIIVPSARAEFVIRVLTTVGFVINPDKSFVDGPFRESCGADYLRGIDIRPSYVKDRLSGAGLFQLHNFFVRKGDEELAGLVLLAIPPRLRLYGPDGYGDGHLLGEWLPKPHRRDLGWSGYTFDTFTFKARKTFCALPGDFVYPCYSIYITGEGLQNEPEDPVGMGTDSPPATYDKRGLLRDVRPGRQGYKRISIYTLTPA